MGNEKAQAVRYGHLECVLPIRVREGKKRERCAGCGIRLQALHGRELGRLKAKDLPAACVPQVDLQRGEEDGAYESDPHGAAEEGDIASLKQEERPDACDGECRCLEGCRHHVTEPNQGRWIEDDGPEAGGHKLPILHAKSGRRLHPTN